MGSPAQHGDWRWFEGEVDPDGDHLRLYFGDESEPAAIVGPPHGRVFPVQFSDADAGSGANERLDAVRAQLDFYLLEVGGPEPWQYAIYHCATAANLYAAVHWAFCPARSTRSGPTQ
jgi:hypothetical protein